MHHAHPWRRLSSGSVPPGSCPIDAGSWRATPWVTMGFFDRLLDASIYFSFDRSGFERHAKRFDEADLDVSMRGKVCAVTGGNRGLGFAVARGLAARGASVHLLCRDPGRGLEARDAIVDETGNADVHVHQVDLASLASIHDFADHFAPSRLDVLIHNAGLLPDRRRMSEDGLELTVAAHVVGPHVLTKRLQPKLAGGRVVFVSSGGMYTKKLDVQAMSDTEGEYDGVAAYAMTKRAQVVLAERWAEALESQETSVHSMHPGWAATPGVATSLPRFFQRMEKRLRTPEQGADTVVWLAVADAPARSTGKFWFDRDVAPTHRLPWTQASPEERDRLWAFAERHGAPAAQVSDHREAS